jgi:hypothetical protein
MRQNDNAVAVSPRAPGVVQCFEGSRHQQVFGQCDGMPRIARHNMSPAKRFFIETPSGGGNLEPALEPAPSWSRLGNVALCRWCNVAGYPALWGGVEARAAVVYRSSLEQCLGRPIANRPQLAKLPHITSSTAQKTSTSARGHRDLRSKRNGRAGLRRFRTSPRIRIRNRIPHGRGSETSRRASGEMSWGTWLRRAG